jgi:hypothetical protein
MVIGPGAFQFACVNLSKNPLSWVVSEATAIAPTYQRYHFRVTKSPGLMRWKKPLTPRRILLFFSRNLKYNNSDNEEQL